MLHPVDPKVFFRWDFRRNSRYAISHLPHTPAAILKALISRPSIDLSREYWEKKPLLIRRKQRGYYKALFSSDALDSVVREVGRMMASLQRTSLPCPCLVVRF